VNLDFCRGCDAASQGTTPFPSPRNPAKIYFGAAR
jgi:hypothetical protein